MNSKYKFSKRNLIVFALIVTCLISAIILLQYVDKSQPHNLFPQNPEENIPQVAQTFK